MRNGIVAYLSSAVGSTLSVFVLAGLLDERVAAAVTTAVGGWAVFVVALNDLRTRRSAP